MAEKRGNWLELRVARRVVESDVVVSLHLVSNDGSALPPFVAGQFLTLRVPKPGGGVMPRNYSLSNGPGDISHYRISVKREGPPARQPELPAGIGSGFVHDVLLEGEIVASLAPRGDFVLDRSSTRPVLLLAGGIGVTPLASMAQVLAAEGKRQVTMIHACENGQVQALGTELRMLAESCPSFRYLVALATPSQQDKTSKLHQLEGFVDPVFLRSVLPIGDYDCYLCGPKGFMQVMYQHLVSLGVREEQIRYEFFGPATLLTARSVTVPATSVAPAPSATLPADGTPTVTFGKSGISFPWDPTKRTLLDFAESHGFTPAFSCRNGICSTCLCIIDGNVNYVEDPLDMPEDGKALICCSIPRGNVILDL